MKRNSINNVLSLWPLLSSELENIGRVSASRLFLANSCGPQIYSEADHDLILPVWLQNLLPQQRGSDGKLAKKMICFSCTESVSFSVDSLYVKFARGVGGAL